MHAKNSNIGYECARFRGEVYSDTKKIERGGMVIEEALGNGVNGIRLRDLGE